MDAMELLRTRASNGKLDAPAPDEATLNEILEAALRAHVPTVEIDGTGTLDEVQAMRDTVPRDGLKTSFRSRTLQQVGKDILGMSRKGLIGRARLNSEGHDESHFLAPLEETLARGTTLAEEMLAQYRGRWEGSIEPLFNEYAY